MNYDLSVIHFRPLELYPPTQNLLILLEARSENTIIVFSTFSSTNQPLFENGQKLHISRTVINSRFRFLRFIGYLRFFLKALASLMINRPSRVIYFESISAIPCLLYKFIFPRTKLFVHYHEYTTKDEYRNGMKIEYFAHKLETRHYHKYDWISHTNSFRLQLFKEDNHLPDNERLNVMPNYPLEKWCSFVSRERSKNAKIRFVYIGALSFQDTYLKEVLNFINNHQNNYEFDFFSFNIDNEIRDYLVQLNCDAIQFKGSIDYFEIPNKVINYDVGLILYKANTFNYKFNAPNKLFEYLRLGLDVWYPKEMLGCKEFQSDIQPKVIEVDFKDISNSTLSYSVELNKETMTNNLYSAELGTKKLLFQLLEN